METQEYEDRAPVPGLGRKLAVVGSTGAGKSTLARTLARRLNLPYIELDALYWEPGWIPALTPVFRERVSGALTGPAWVADGNYQAVRDIVWGRADSLIWLDYSLPLVLRRLMSRTLKRLARRTELWNGNREQLRGIFSRDSLFLWAISTHRRRRRDYAQLFQRPEYAHLQVVHIRTPRSLQRWLGAQEFEVPSLERGDMPVDPSH